MINQEQMKRYKFTESLIADLRIKNDAAEIEKVALDAFIKIYAAYQEVIIDIYNKIDYDSYTASEISMELERAGLKMPIEGFQEMWDTFWENGYILDHIADLDVEMNEARYDAEAEKFYVNALDWSNGADGNPAQFYLTLTPDKVLALQDPANLNREKEKFRQLIMPVAQPSIDAYENSKTGKEQEFEKIERAEYERLKRKFEPENYDVIDR